MKTLLVSAMMLSSLLLGAQPVVPTFVEEPGRKEFTGMMIARPLQAGELRRRGLDAGRIAAARRNAIALATPYARAYLRETDQFHLRVPKGMDENQLARLLVGSGLFEYVQPDWRVYPTQFVPNDALYNQQWALPAIQAPEAWAVFSGAGTDQGPIIAITDTGLRRTHEDFTNPPNRVLGANTFRDPTVTEASDPAIIDDINGHGTHVASIAVGVGNNGRGISGSLMRGRLMVIRVSEWSGGSSSQTRLIRGMLWAGQNGAKVVSTSYAGANDPAIQTAGNTLRTQYGTLSIWAAGNAGQSFSQDHADVLVVGSLDSNGARSSFSNFGPLIDLMAPGRGITAAYHRGDNDYAVLDGTSMAAPLVAGAAGLLLGFEPELGPVEVANILGRSSIDMGNQLENGWGRLNLWNAIGRAPTSTNLFRGLLISGSTVNLRSSDGSAMTIQRGPVLTSSEAPIQLLAEVEAPNFGMLNPSYHELRVRIADRVNTSGLQASVEAWAWTAGQWRSLGTYTPTTTQNARSLTISSGVNDLVNSETRMMRLRIRYRQVGPVLTSGWRASLDLVNLRVLREN